MTDITTAKRLMAAVSSEAAGILGAGVSRPCFIGRYNRAAQVVLSDGRLNSVLTPGDRRLIASFIEEEEGEGPRDFMLRVRLSDSERDRLEQLCQAAGQSMSEYVRERIIAMEQVSPDRS